ncbi:MAG: CtsR family transcriptional regulator [Candidatus Spyradocola sp.]|nr:CtsR family transcriptional regulator [Candidatus Spyradocola sp.]
MARLCDDIERFILQAMQQRSWVELQRNILAAQFSCAPSQINYVLSTRFTPAQGYRVETRRGGGGFVRVFRIDRSRVDYMQGVCAQLPAHLTAGQAESVVEALRKGGVLSPAQARLLLAAVGEPDAEENEGAQRMRAGILCRMLICAAKEEEQHDVR